MNQTFFTEEFLRKAKKRHRGIKRVRKTQRKHWCPFGCGKTVIYERTSNIRGYYCLKCARHWKSSQEYKKPIMLYDHFKDYVRCCARCGRYYHTTHKTSKICTNCYKLRGGIMREKKIKRICGNCTHSDNNLGMFALYCDLITGNRDNGEYNDGKVRSWQKCKLNPEKFNPRAKSKEKNIKK